MTTDKNQQHLELLLRELRSLSHETPWVEFKENQQKPEEIGEYISALSNSEARPLLTWYGVSKMALII